MFGYIYMTTNLINGKKYIGEHRSEQIDPYYYGSGTILKEAMRKYGKHNFKCDILEWCETESELHSREIYWISYYNAVESDDFYNLDVGGAGTHLVSAEASSRMSSAKKGCTPWNKGKTMSNEFCKKVSESLMGRKSWAKGLTKEDDPRVAKFSHKLSDETKKLLGDLHRGVPSKLKGRTLSDEHCKKISDAKRGIQFSDDHKKKLSLAKGQKVLCVETNIIYNSIKEASVAMGYKSGNSIAGCVKNPSRTAKGYHWKLIE